MAYVIGRKVIKDTEEEFDSFAYGITLPLKRGNGGYFEQAFTSYEQAKTNLKNLLLTRKGERIMQPNFGTGLHSLLFEPMDGEYEGKLRDTITRNVSYWLPYINIQNIEVEMTDELKDKNQANLYLEFTVGNQIETQEITFTVQG
jgi:phage baseplate assembly protein W